MQTNNDPYNGRKCHFQRLAISRLQCQKYAKALILRTIKNQIPYLTFPSIIIFLVVFGFFEPGPFFFVFFPGLLVWSSLLYRNRNLQIDAMKPISRSKLFLSEYAGYYLLAMIMISLIVIGIKIPDTISGRRFYYSSEAGFDMLMLPSIFGGLFAISLHLLITNRFQRSLIINYFTFFLSVGLAINIIKFSTQIINGMILSLILLALTVLLSVISFKLDLKRDII